MAALTLESAGLVPAANEYYNIGKYTRSVSTSNNDAQTWFNRGFVWAYSFNHLESAACFGQVIAHDPSCAMGYWGRAYSSGPNYNKIWKAFDAKDKKATVERCHKLARQAKEFAKSASPLEQALIEAIQLRYPDDQVPDDDNFAPWNLAYADAMREVYKQFGHDDLDVITLTADALMNTAPRNLFSSQTGEPILSTPVVEVGEILEAGMRHPKAKYHPGILHLVIHYWEMSRTPGKALLAADFLRDLVPDAGHMSHMPCHIDVLVGDYRRAVNTNLTATIADDKFLAKEGAKNFYSLYRFHNYHSLIYAATMAGQAQAALEATSRMEATITDDLLLITSPPMADWLESFNAVRIHVLIRFGMWEELKALPIPKNQELYCTTVALTHYGKGVAWAATGDVAKADQERELYRAAAKRVPPSRMDFPNRVVDILEVATAMLDGEIEYRRGDYDKAFASIRLAMDRDDDLVYSEPWGWPLPTRHAYAALKLEQNQLEEAAKAYADDLGLTDKLVPGHQHPNNIWALHGYHECLTRLGRTAEANIIAKQLAIAANGADIVVKSSCFCRLDVMQNGTNGISGCNGHSCG